jgi:integrase
MRPQFRSRLAKDLTGFIHFKRSLGCQYIKAASILIRFDGYVAEHCPRRGPIRLDRLINGWLTTLTCTPRTIGKSLAVVRQFCVYRRRTDPGGFVPGVDWAFRRKGTPSFKAHIFSPKEIRLMLRKRRFGRTDPRSKALRVLLLILYCTGLRIGEAVRLRVEDVDLSDRTFFIGPSKGRARWVPFGADLARELRQYLKNRRPPVAAGGSVFVLPNGVPLRRDTARYWITTLLQTLKLKPPSGRVGPRVHDLRHSFAVHRLTRWYRQGIDLQSRLPWLSAYMGHDNIFGTQVYLNATPELLQLAAHRFEARLKGARRA